MTVNRQLLVLSVAYLFAGSFADAAEPSTPLYRDASQPIEKRIEDLLGRMTLEEKVGQMNMPCVYESGLGKSIPEKTDSVQKFATGNLLPKFGPGGGFFTLPNTILHEGTRQQAEFLNRLQKLAREQTRLGIPLLETEEGTHGLMCPGATIFPEGPSLGSTWNIELLSRVYTTAAVKRGPSACISSSRWSSSRFVILAWAQRGSVQRRSVPLFADRRDDCPLGGRQQPCRGRQGCLRPLSLSRSEPTGQRPRTRSHGNLGTNSTRGLPSSLAGGNQERRSARRHGDLSGGRWRSDACFTQATDTDTSRGAGLRRPGSVGGRRNRYARL